MDKKSNNQEDSAEDKGTLALIAGAGFGVYGTTLAIAGGVVCPTCVIATPALIGYGLYKRQKAKNPQQPSLQDQKNSDN